MFRRRKAQEPEADEIEDLGEGIDDDVDDETDDATGGSGGSAPTGTGPWDADEDVSDVERVDLGGIQVPLVDGIEVQVNVADEQIVAATIQHGTSAMQVQAFAAPKSAGLWRDVRREIIAELKEGGGSAEEADGPFGPELTASVPSPDAGKGGPATQPARFVGVDGPRWFLRGVISGAAASDASAAEPLEAVFADIVVVRGDDPMAPRDLLELRLPREAQQALDEQAAKSDLDPFQRGPEITEVR
ncbi:MAG TPA: DUF3710 domain-containing protein [Streptosporangiaceae bacterium]